MGAFIDFDHVKANANVPDVLAELKINAKGRGEELRIRCPHPPQTIRPIGSTKKTIPSPPQPHKGLPREP